MQREKREDIDRMKNKIKKFSKGDFHTQQPEIRLPQTNLVLTIGEGEVYSGSFAIENRREGNVRGLVYPSSFRMHCKEQGFEGHEVTIEFTYDGTNLPPGHVEHGKFTIVCNGGEFEIPFTAIIEKPYLTTSYGKIQNLGEFKKLAMRDFTEAQRIFRAMEFYEILKYEDQRIYHLYDNMRKWSLGEQALEEFLVGVKQKERIFLCLSAEEKMYEKIEENTMDSVTVTKNTWGYMPVKLHVKGAFLEVTKEEFATDEFVGNLYELEYIILEDKLHCGKNFGQISIETPYETILYDVEASKEETVKTNVRENEFVLAQILKGYLAVLAGRVELGAWADNAIEKAKGLRERNPGVKWYQLLIAHLHIFAEQQEEARFILEHYSYNRNDKEQKVEVGAYYLYLTALIKKEGTHVTRVLEELERLYMRHPQSWQILSMLAEIDPRYNGSSEKLRVLERQFFNGSNHVIPYAQAFLSFREQNTRLKKLGAFEVQVFHFAVKYKLLTKELVLYMANLASQQKTFDQRLFEILEHAYKVFEDPMVLTTICTLLIKGNKTQNQYFKWYQKAVDAGLKIAQLYEYYMMSIDETRVRSPLPRSIYLYFMHGNSLEYKKASLLYSSILTYEDETSEVADVYREQIQRFAWEQLSKRHINEQLRIIYKQFCREEDMDGERLGAVYDICHAYEIKTKMKNMKYILVIEKDGTIKQKIPYFDGGAIAFLYSKESRIIWESKDGRYYIDSIPYDTKRMFFELQFVDLYKKYEAEIGTGRPDQVKKELTFETLRQYGIESFDETEVFKLISKKIREENYEEEDFLTHVCITLYEKEQYDKVILTYLGNYYCGATKDMKKLFYLIGHYEISTHKLAERIITQMLFSEDVFQETEIFLEYYRGGTYFRLKQAYLAYISREYVVRNRIMDQAIFEIIQKEQESDEYLADICKIAMLKYYSDKEISEDQKVVLHAFLKEMCEKQMVFPCYMSYPASWLRETLLYDKTMVAFRAKSKAAKVKMIYEIRKDGEEEFEYHTEPLMPVLEKLYVKQFVLFQNEELTYYFKETLDGQTYTSGRKSVRMTRKPEEAGRYGRLNKMSQMDEDELQEEITAYEYENFLSEQIFKLY